MPRIRTIKPEIAHDVALARLSRDARYTFVLCIAQSDDYGLLLGNPRQLLGTLYPHDDDVSVEVLGGWIRELLAAGMVNWRVRNDGQPVLQVVNWQRHQKVDHPHKPVLLNDLLPEDSGDATVVLAKLSRGTREVLPPPSRTDLTTERPDDLTTEDLGDAGASPDNQGRTPRKRRSSARPPSDDPSAPPPPTWVHAVHEALLEHPKVFQPHGKIGGTLAAVVRATGATPDQLREAVRDYDAHLYAHGRRAFVLTHFAAELPKLLAMQGEPYGDGHGTSTARGRYVLGDQA